MAHYRDPYTDQQPGAYDQQYTHSPAYNPYDPEQRNQAYDQGAYDTYTTGGYRDDPNAIPPPQMQEPNPHDQAGFAKEHQPEDFKSWRKYGRSSDLWTRGGRGSCIGRFCCCTLMIVIFFIISILLALLMWVRPPDAVVGTVGPSTTQNAVQLGTGSIAVNLGVGMAITNPNFFAVSFKSIDAQAFYPINNTLVGTGNETDITFNANSQTNFTFPFTLDFSTTMSSSTEILSDLASKCGVGGGAVQDITINLDITLGLRILFFVVYPVVNIPVSFACPISASDIAGLVSSLGSGLPGLP